jgi:hypothetical protein
VSKFKEERVALPDGEAIIRELSASKRDAYEQGMVRTVDGKREADLTNMRAKLVALCWVNEDGQPKHTAQEVGDEPASYVEPMYLAAQRVNATGPDALDTAAKNSPPSDASTSV